MIQAIPSMKAELLAVAKKSLVGIGVPIGSVIAAITLESVSKSLQFAALAIGVATGIAMFISTCLTVAWKLERNRQERKRNRK
jgi:zinc transporter ZupT